MLPPRKMRTALQRLSVGAERWLGRAANALWPAYRAYADKMPSQPVHPKWAPAPLLRKKERTFPVLGWPRRTDSLCPECVREVRASVLAGEMSLNELTSGRPGEIT